MNEFIYFRFISQRQYKRKLRRDCPSYATLQRPQRRSSASAKNCVTTDKSNGADVTKDSQNGYDVCHLIESFWAYLKVITITE